MFVYNNYYINYSGNLTNVTFQSPIQYYSRNEYNTQQNSIIHSLLILLRINEYFEQQTTDLLTHILQFIAIILCIIYPLRDDIEHLLFSRAQKEQKVVHVYPSPNQMNKGYMKKNKKRVEEKGYKTWNDVILMVMIQIAIVTYIASAGTFAPFYENDSF